MIFLISNSDLNQFGCSQCGCFSGSFFGEIKKNNISIWRCNSCFSTSLISQTESLTEQPSSCKMAIGNHPLKERASFSCCDDNNFVDIIGTGKYSTLSCWIGGGREAERNSIVLSTNCPLMAKSISSLFQYGTLVDGNYVILGVDELYSNNLHNLMWHVLLEKQINLKIINKYKDKK